MQCKHERSEPRLRTKKNGAIVVCKQCLDCGTSLGELSKAGFNISVLVPFDGSIRERFELKQREIFDRQREISEMEQADKTSFWWETYKIYLNSDHWRSVRHKVLNRDSLCQVCFKAPASQAHHLSYASFSKWGISFPIECVGVCEACHDRLHEKESEAVA